MQYSEVIKSALAYIEKPQNRHHGGRTGADGRLFSLHITACSAVMVVIAAHIPRDALTMLWPNRRRKTIDGARIRL